MSFMDNIDSYKKMVSEEIMQTPCTMDESSTEFMVLPKYEHIEESLVVGEEIVVDENMDLDQQISEEAVCESKEAVEYFERDINATIPVEFVEDSVSLSTTNIAKQEWLPDDANNQDILLSEPEESESEIGCSRITSDDQYEDEETIATFVTATGQQLALYAVEDSEEIFAVAMYDESGVPPTSFQFLMKSDVERLIGEGAVRTVRKPTQIKKQLLTTQPPIFFSKNDSTDDILIHNENKIETKHETLQKEDDSWEENSTLMEDSNLNLHMKRVSNIIYASDDKHSDLTYLMMDNCPVNIDNSEEYQEEDESDSEILEQSTVQYILFEGDQSDSELTFDEIQTTLRNLKTAESKSSRRQLNKKLDTEQDSFANVKQSECDHSVDNNSNCNHISNTLTERKLNLVDSEKESLELFTDSTMNGISNNTNLDLANGSIECVSPESTQMQYRTKRSRKQQLISVNREDSEIIIQPASLLSEEDNNVKKRGKRKKYRQRSNDAKRMKKVKRKEVEVIEIDVDEEENMLQSKRDVVEITIDDSKDKYSSDKENEIIMVGDSDEESSQSNSKKMLLQCQHCARNFRQQRAFETHLRVCSKSPSNSIRFKEQKIKHSSRTNEDAVKKEYTCKICQEKFDVVVVLARHVRSEHSQRKKRRLSKSSIERQSKEVEEKKESIESKKELTMIKNIKRKRNQRLNCTWEVKKLSCSDCGRWFPSAPLLRAHCLQHGTKKTEHKVRRCHICQKLIKSRLLFVQHLKKHRSMRKTPKTVTNIQKKLHTTRSVTRKIKKLRKRGRPRKL
ncbi:uncharacterized protein LOC143210770 isoform X2 [Lasioglossum baleicum]|uniref:uncharacterized protein LOC143210770 isoform X2 n=1 Tax=Lasioglossum baleicum TaxID=434251 RepID=UPI003FCD5FF2